MKVFLTGMRAGKRFSETLSVEPDNGGEMRQVAVWPRMTYQTIRGFGGAFTDAAGYVYSMMGEADRKDMIDTYFNPDQMGYAWGRASIDSCDFGLEMYAADDDPDDTALERMDFTRNDRYVLPLLMDAQAAAGRPIQMMLTPWSPPAWMKTNQSRVHGGALRPECAPVWAEYICKYIGHCLDAGMDVRLLSSQNEPHAVQTWDSCIMTDAQEAAFLRDHLLPALRRHGLDGRISTLIWDHNKEHMLNRTLAVLDDPTLVEGVAGVAFHWYSGDHFENIAMTRERFPGKRLVFTEGCVEHSIYGTEAELHGAIKYAHEYIGDLNAGVDTFIDWNLLLDERGGPNHVGNFCDAPMMYDTVEGKLHKKLSLDYIGHFSRHIRPGSVRLGVSRFSQDIEVAAARNHDGSIVAVALNPTDAERRFNLRVDDRFYPVALPAGAIATCVER